MALKLSELQGQYEEVEKPKTGMSAGIGKFAKGVGIGALKSVGETALGIGELGRKAQSGIARLFGAESALGGEGMFDSAQAEQIRQTTLKANAPGQGTGKFLGTAAQYLIPTSGVTKGQQILGAAASQLPKTAGLQLAGKAAARFIPEAMGTGLVAGVRSGGDMEQTKQEALTAGAFSVGLGALGGLARSTYWPMLDDSVNKALGTQGKKSGGVALKETAKKVSGLKVLKDRAPKLTVTLDDGAKAAFDPQNASYGTTLQAWNEARKQVFDEYTTLASKAGEKSTLDLSPVRQQIADALDAPILSVEKNAVRSILNDFDEIFKDPSKVDMQAAERFVKSLNENTVQGFFSGTSDAASSKVNAGTARLIRDILDDTIEETTGAQYQTLRTQYAALKSLEDDLVRKFQQDARSIGGGLPEYTGAFASGDIIGSALSLDPAQFAKGATLGTFSVLKRKLSNPERFLRRSFDLVDDVPSDLGLRVFGGTKSLTEKEAMMADDVAESVINPNIGMSVRNVSDEIGNIESQIKRLEGMGVSPKDARIKRLLDARDELYKIEGKPSFNQGATPSTNLLEEAKKYKSAEEFVDNLSKKNKVFFHSTDSDLSDLQSGFDITKSAKGEKENFFNPLGKGMYVSNNPDFTRRFGKNTFAYVLPDNANVKSLSEKAWNTTEYDAIIRGTLRKAGIKWDDLTLDEKVNINRLVPNTPIESLNEASVYLEDVAERLGKKVDMMDLMMNYTTERYSKYDAVRFPSTDFYQVGDTTEILIPEGKIKGQMIEKSQLEDIWKQANQ